MCCFTFLILSFLKLISTTQVTVRNLNLVGSQAWTLMREGEAEKQVLPLSFIVEEIYQFLIHYFFHNMVFVMPNVH